MSISYWLLSALGQLQVPQRSAKKCNEDVFYLAVFEVGREGESTKIESCG